MSESTREQLASYLAEIATAGTHLNLPQSALAQVAGGEVRDLRDEFACDERFAWVRDRWTVPDGGSIVDMAGSAGYFSLRALESGLAARSTVYDIYDRALDLGGLVARVMGQADRITYRHLSLELQNLTDLPEADTVFCFNLVHHAGTVFDEKQVAQVGWERYAVDYFKILREKFKHMYVSLGFKGPHKPTGLRVPFHRCEQYFADRVLAPAGWECRDSANVGLLRAGKAPNSLRAGPRPVLGFLDLLWGISGRWGLTYRATRGMGWATSDKLSKYCIFAAS